MFEDDVEYFWEYNMITSGTSTTERCMTGMIQNDYLLQKNDASLHWVTSSTKWTYRYQPIPESISISNIQHHRMPCVMVGKNISQNIIWLEVLLELERFAAKINQKISLKENDGRPLKSSSIVDI